MTQIFKPEDMTLVELAQGLTPQHKHTKLARSAAEFIFEALARPNQHPLPDLETLRNFIDHLITKKGYN